MRRQHSAAAANRSPTLALTPSTGTLPLYSLFGSPGVHGASPGSLLTTITATAPASAARSAFSAKAHSPRTVSASSLAVQLRVQWRREAQGCREINALHCKWLADGLRTRCNDRRAEVGVAGFVICRIENELRDLATNRPPGWCLQYTSSQPSGCSDVSQKTEHLIFLLSAACSPQRQP